MSSVTLTNTNIFNGIAAAAATAYRARQAEQTQAAAARDAQLQLERQAQREAEKAAFVTDLCALWNKMSGTDPVIDEVDIEYESGDGFAWRIAPDIRFRIYTAQREKNLRLDGLPYGTKSRIDSLADLGEALEALAAHQQKLAAEKEKQALRDQEEQERQRRREEACARYAEIEAREPAAPGPVTVFCDGGGIHIRPMGVEFLTICPFLLPECDELDRPVAGPLLEFTFQRHAAQALLDGLNLAHGALQIDSKYYGDFVVARPGSLTWFRMPRGYSTEWDEREEPAGAVVQQDWSTPVDFPNPAWLKTFKAALRDWLVCCKAHDAWTNEMADAINAVAACGNNIPY